MQEAQDYLDDPDLMSRIVDDVNASGVAGERELIGGLWLIAISRMLPAPLSVIVQGSSSSGKSYVIEKVASLLPAEHVIPATQMTPQALFHMPAGELRHKLIVGGERSRVQDDDRAEATRALREMISSGRLSKMMPVKVPGGAIETQLIEQEGPIAFVESTTLAKVFAEDENRCVLLQTDETKQQTDMIIELTATRFQGPGHVNKDHVVQVHHTLQRLLQYCSIVIPYAKLLGVTFPTDRVEARRAFSHLLNMISARVLLHQRQRVLDAEGHLVAERKDYEIARHLLLRPLARLLGDAVPEATRSFHTALAQAYPTATSGGGSTSFTSTEAKALVKKSASASSVGGWLNALRDAGAVETLQPASGSRAATWRVVLDTLPSAVIALPTADQIFGPAGGPSP